MVLLQTMKQTSIRTGFLSFIVDIHMPLLWEKILILIHLKNDFKVMTMSFFYTSGFQINAIITHKRLFFFLFLEMNDPTNQDARSSPRVIPVHSKSVYCSSKFTSSNSQHQDNECYLSNTHEGNCLFFY
jgi:hypothetical protein